MSLDQIINIAVVPVAIIFAKIIGHDIPKSAIGLFISGVVLFLFYALYYLTVFALERWTPIGNSCPIYEVLLLDAGLGCGIPVLIVAYTALFASFLRMLWDRFRDE